MVYIVYMSYIYTCHIYTTDIKLSLYYIILTYTTLHTKLVETVGCGEFQKNART